MKVNFQEYDSKVEIRLIPETTKETAQLLRFGANAKKDNVSVRSYFIGDHVDTNILFEIKDREQISIGNMRT